MSDRENRYMITKGPVGFLAVKVTDDQHSAGFSDNWMYKDEAALRAGILKDHTDEEIENILSTLRTDGRVEI